MLGVTTGAFYKAFENKEDLYYQVCLLENQSQLRRLEEQYIDGVSDPLDCILADRTFSFYRNMRPTVR